MEPSRTFRDQIPHLNLNENATKPTLLPRALERHQSWIQSTLGVPFANTVIFEVHLDLTQIGADRILACSNRRAESFEAASRLNPLLSSATTPQGFPPLVELSKTSFKLDLLSLLEDAERPGQFQIEWQDCPIAMQIDRIFSPVVAMNASYHAGPCCDMESVAHLLITKRECPPSWLLSSNISIDVTRNPDSMCMVGRPGRSRDVSGASSCWTRGLYRLSRTTSNHSSRERAGSGRSGSHSAGDTSCTGRPETEKRPPSER
jgi:hypothetical protein